MSKQRTKHIKVYRDACIAGVYEYFAWDKHTDEYNWADTAAEARKGVEERNAGIRTSCKLAYMRNFVPTLQKMI